MENVVVFVPGFLGSELNLGDQNLGELNKVWLGIPTFLGGGYRFLDLEGQFPIPGNLPILVTRVLKAVYGDFITWLCGIFDSVYTWPWDWRFSVADAVPGLRSLLAVEFAKGNRVTVIGHSAGGRVAALALNGIPFGSRTTLNYLVTIGTPWRGSWRAAEALLGRAESVRQGAFLAASAQLGLPRIERYRIQRVLSTLPGLYELFPSPELQSSLSPAGSPDVWNPAAWAGIFQPLNPAKLAAGKTFAENAPVPDATIPHVNVFGVGLGTPGPFSAAEDLAESNLNYGLEGDGVVPVDSAAVKVPRQTITLRVTGEHGRLCSASDTMFAIRPLL